MSDLISRQDALDAVSWDTEAYTAINNLPLVEPLTDAEQRIFLRAISFEEEVCKKVDAEWGAGDPECEINLVHVCHEIKRKVKGVLWT